MNYQETYQEWLNNPYFDEATKEELKNIQDDDNEIKERFYSDLAFGTAGLRGIIGAGINRMNIYVVRKATQGLADYILEQGTDKKRVAIAFDSRHMSPEFADEAALCLAANGIKAYILNHSVRPRNCPLQSATITALLELTLLPATILRNITAIKYTGRTVRSLRRLTTKG